MKGVLLCGGEGTRLRPHTEVINKHLVRVGELPMAEYPLRKMIEAGIQEILVVSGGSNFAAVVKYFGSGSKWGVSITHAIQDQAGGIAQALSLARNFAGREKILVVLGDNLFNMNIKKDVDRFNEDIHSRCMLFSYEVNDPSEYGVIKFNNDGAIDVIEKPKNPPSKYILAGIYAYDPVVFDIIGSLNPSARGELEISDVNRYYVRARMAEIIPMSGWWCDCGKMATLLQAEERIQHDRPI